MNNPEYVKIEDTLYKINTDFRTAIDCNEIISDESISDRERALAIIYLLYGDKGIEAYHHYQELLNKAIKYLTFNKENIEEDNERPNMDFKQDMWLIEASFKSDYAITLKDEKMHYWDFYKYINGLTDKCILNRVRELRDYDVSKIKDIKEKEKIIKQQKQFELKKKKKRLNNEQLKSINEFYEKLGITREE